MAGASAEVPSVGDRFDRVATRYDMAHTGASEQRYNDVARRIIAKTMQPYDEICDLGCGTGAFLDLGFQVDWWDYWGVDVSPGMIAEASRKHPEYHDRFVLQDMRDLDPFSCDFAVSLGGSLSYIVEPNLRFLYRILRPGGRFVVSLYGRGRGLDMSPHYQTPIRRYNMSDIRRAFRKFGWNACGVNWWLGDNAGLVSQCVGAAMERICPGRCEHIFVSGQKPYGDGS